MSVLRFRSVAVRRMPGIYDGGFELRELAGGVNLVFGPNASGKSTTARAIEAMLWPANYADASAWLEGTFDLDGEQWWVELDANRGRVQRGGINATLPNVLPPEARDRYRLPLHELLKAEDLGMARAIALESVGGYDLPAAARLLGPRTSLSRPKAQQDALRSARERLRESRAVLDRLQMEAETLRGDERRLARRADVERRIAHLRRVVEHAARSEDVRRAEAELQSFAPAIARLAGDEGRRVADLTERLEREQAEAVQAAGRLKEAERDLARSGLGEEVARSEEIDILLHEVEDAERIEGEIRSADREVSAARQAEGAEVRRLGIFSDAERAAELDLGGLAEIVRAVETLIDTRTQRIALEREVSLLPAGEAADRNRLERGAMLLQQWLRARAPEADRNAGIRKLALAGAILLVISGLGFALLSPAGFAAAAAGAILLLRILSAGSAPDLRPHLQSEYAQLALELQPTLWEAEPVHQCADRLAERLAQLHIVEQAQQRRERLLRDLGPLREREDRLAAAVQEVGTPLGIAPPEEVPLVYILERISRLHDARSALLRAEGERVEAWEHRSALLERSNQRLARLGLEPVGDLVTLRTAVSQLRERREQHRLATAAAEAAARDLTRARTQIDQCRADLAALFGRLEVEPVDATILLQWCAERPRLVDAQRRFDIAEGDRARLEHLLRLDPEFVPEDLEPALPEVESRIRELEEELSELDGVRDRVVKLRADIERATRGHVAEDALAEVQRCTQALREVRERDTRSAIADALVSYVERETKWEDRPEVFHRASRLFTRITRGRYELRLDGGGDASFRAWDTERGRAQPLDELSSATRVQLLLAVRVAFVEAQEGGIRLPLLMDETLANSDAARAAAIMEAVLTLATEGRQVFYFTAQPDEVRRWRELLESRGDIEWRAIDLAEVRRQERSLDLTQLLRKTEAPPAVPEPAGATHAEYGALLGIPPVDPTGPSGALHLWYVVEEPETLHRLITRLGSDRIGTFRSLMERGITGDFSQDEIAEIEVRVVTAESALRRLAVGRGRKVDRHVLQRSGEVSENFIDRVAEVAQSLDGDAAGLIAALEEGQVARFLQKKTDALREFFETEGYLDTRQRLRPEQVRAEVLGDLSAAIRGGRITISDVDRLLARLGVRVPVAGQPESYILELWP